MSRFTTYTPGDGPRPILATHQTADGVVVHDADDTVSAATHYVEDGALYLRPQIDVSNWVLDPSTDPVQLCELPKDTEVLIEAGGPPIRLVTDGAPLVLTPNQILQMDFTLTPPFPYRTAKFHVSIREPLPDVIMAPPPNEPIIDVETEEQE